MYRKWHRAQSESKRRMLSSTGMAPPLGGWRRRGRRSLAPNHFCPVKRVSSSESYLGSIMEAVGLIDVRVVPVSKYLRLDSFEGYWKRFVLASPNMKRFVDRCLSSDEVVQLKDEVYRIL